MGGCVFKNGIPTMPIKKEDIKPTINNFVNEFIRIFPNSKIMFDEIHTLGSVYKKDISGDIDLAIDEYDLFNIDWGISKDIIDELFNKFKKRARTATDHQLIKRAYIIAISDYIKEHSKLIITDGKSSGSGILFCEFPQYNQPDKYVQIDMNFGNIDWLTFAYYSDIYQGNIKGLHRTQLILHMFSYKGYGFSHNYGVKNNTTQEIVAETPQQAIDLLNKLYNISLDESILNNYFKLQDYLKNNLSKTELEGIYNIYLKTLDSTRCDIPEDLQEYWINHKDILNLKGKFLPETSKLYPLCQEV